MVESEIKRISKYLQVPLGKISHTDDNIIEMKTDNDGKKIVGYSTILNHFHQIFAKENKTSENYFLTKQYFDFANLFIRSTSKRDKCKLPIAWFPLFSLKTFKFQMLHVLSSTHTLKLDPIS